MKNRIRGLALAAAFIGLISSQAIAAVVPNLADFVITEVPGQYTVYNNSTDWYIYAFAVTNPNAAVNGASATTSFSNWTGLTLSLTLDQNVSQPAFGYRSPLFLDVNDPTSITLSSLADLNSLLGPGSFSDQFFFSPSGTASDWGMLLINADGVTLGQLNGSINTPLPGTLPLFASGLTALSLLGWRRKQKRSP